MALNRLRAPMYVRERIFETLVDVPDSEISDDRIDKLFGREIRADFQQPQAGSKAVPLLKAQNFGTRPDKAKDKGLFRVYGSLPDKVKSLFPIVQAGGFHDEKGRQYVVGYNDRELHVKLPPMQEFASFPGVGETVMLYKAVVGKEFRYDKYWIKVVQAGEFAGRVSTAAITVDWFEIGE